MKYDDISWHTGGNYPDDLPPENAATHIGMFLAWCLYNGFASDELKELSGVDIYKVTSGTMTGAQFLAKNCDGKFWDTDLTETGQAFAAEYYMGNAGNAKTVGSYMRDYCGTLDEKAEKTGVDYPTPYHYEDMWENYVLVAAKIDERFAVWKDTQERNA